MKIINKKIKDLKPYKNNPRKISEKAVDMVAKSIKSFGFKIPIIIDSNNEIVSGHTRLLASKQLELKEVPCIVVGDLTPEQIKAFRLADNKVSEYSQWDLELLNIELPTIDFDMFQFEFTVSEIGTEIPLGEDEKEKEKEEKTAKCPDCGKIFYI